MSPPRHHQGARGWRRRFLLVAVLISVVWIGVGVFFGVLGRNAERASSERGPRPIVPAVVAAAVLATFVAYRRLAGPVADLLGGAERIGAGDYAARVAPAGPRSVRMLGRSFNDMAGRLDSSERARRRFLADVSHELRTPLSVLRAEIEAQLDGIHPRDDAHLDILLDQTRTLDRLVEDLRTLALGDAGQLTLHRDPVPMAVLVADAVAAVAPTARRRDVALHTEVPGEAGAIELDVDAIRIGQVLGNLLANAVRHVDGGGHVTVAAAADGATVEIAVTDDGNGITGDPERIFDRFTRSSDSVGSGLGLTIARQLVEAHGGTLTAANVAAGGARFTVRLPAGPHG
ncbi:MAG: ATP-binding protein [Ilumatobacteraceae bacterium]